MADPAQVLAALESIGRALNKIPDRLLQENHMPTIISNTFLRLAPPLADPSGRRPVMRVRAYRAQYTEPRGKVLFWTAAPITEDGPEPEGARFATWRAALDFANRTAQGGVHDAA